MKTFESVAHDLALRGEPGRIVECLREAYEAGLEDAAAQFDERARVASKLIPRSINVTEMQLHSGDMLRAQLYARNIRALKQSRAPRSVSGGVQELAPPSPYNS